MWTIIIELIDTLWNVNYLQRYLILSALWELIDTLWNVNLTIGVIAFLIP